jgi:hypothetical protein
LCIHDSLMIAANGRRQVVPTRYRILISSILF